MSWPCFNVVSIRRGDWEPTESGGRIQRLYYTLPDGREVEFKDLPVGAMWHTDMVPPLSDGYKLYENDPSLCVLLPGKSIWHMHHKGTDGCLWNISGSPPRVTASPSINLVGIYHGWVRDGVVTDDCDGRRFGADGIRIP
jgi:hypothetical protein